MDTDPNQLHCNYTGRTGGQERWQVKGTIGEKELNQYLMSQTEERSTNRDLIILFQDMEINTKIIAKRTERICSGEREIRGRRWGLFFSKYL